MVRRLAWLFAVTGAAIFAALTSMLLSGESRLRVPAIAALITFAAVILSFLGGIEWGLAVHEEPAPATPPREREKARALALTMSAVPSLAAWGLFWLPSPQWQLATSLGLFIAVWAADLWLARHGLIPTWFVDLRTAVTAGVLVILGAALYLL